MLKGKPIRLLTNNPLKQNQMIKNGQPVSETVSHVAGIGAYNLKYMQSKVIKGHTLPPLE
jgi:GTP cyclohydrolase II